MFYFRKICSVRFPRVHFRARVLLAVFKYRTCLNDNDARLTTILQGQPV